jgi:hypothetical protein
VGDNINQHKSMAMGRGVQGSTPRGKGPASAYKKGGLVKGGSKMPSTTKYAKAGKNC